MQPIISRIRSGMARLLRQRVVLFALAIGVSYIVWDAPLIFGAPPTPPLTCAIHPDDYYTTIPNGNVALVHTYCVTCHATEDGGGGDQVVGFGLAYQAQAPLTLSSPRSSTFTPSLANTWGPTLAIMNSGNGYTYGEKLQDPTGAWQYNAVPYTQSSGDPALVVNPNDVNQLPQAPQISAITGVITGTTYSNSVSLGVELDTTIGARQVVYEVLNGATVVKSYPAKHTNTTYGGYTPNVTDFTMDWDTNDVPNGVYTVRATLSDALTTEARTSIRSVANVTINNPARTLRYVATSGSDTANACTNSAAPCATIDQAVSQAQNNDEIRVAGGMYTPGSGTAVLIITSRMKIIGGYSTGNWSTPDRVANPTILDGQNQRTVLRFDVGSAGFILQNVTIQHGAASGGSGSGVIMFGAPGTITDDVFDSNAATDDGGALYAFMSDGTTIKNTFFRNNSAGGSGGALVLDANNSPMSSSVSNVLFANNTAAQGGAITIRNGGSATLSYATIAGSGAAAAVRLDTGNQAATLTNVLISGYGTGISVVDATSSLTLGNVLIANDGANNVATPITKPNGFSVSGTPIRGLAGYKNAAAGDYHLAFGAPAIDAGIVVNGISTDLDGLTRPFTTPLPNIIVTPPDIGAYEYSSPYAIVYFVTTTLNVTLPVQVAHVQINLTQLSLSPVTVQYATQDSDAIAGVDYTAMSGTLTIPANDSDVGFDIPILATDIKTARSFTINLSNPTVAQLNIITSMMVTINPADVIGPPQVVLTASVPNALRSGPIPGVFTLTRDVLINTALTVHYTVGGSADAGVDYATLPGSITFQPGESEVSIKVVPIGGRGDKLVTLTLTPSSDYLLGRSSATVGISGVARWWVYTPLTLR